MSTLAMSCIWCPLISVLASASELCVVEVVVLAAEVVRHLVVHGDVGLCRLQDENCDGARRRLLWHSVVVCSLFGRSRGVLPAAAGSSFLLAPQLASGFNTNHTSTTTAAFAKTATLHPLASSLDGLLWKKRRLGVVYTSLAGRRLLGHQLQPFVAALTEAAGATQHI